MMRAEIDSFIRYLEIEKGASQNTLLSYNRDLRQMIGFFEERGITKPEEVTEDALDGYMVNQRQGGRAAATISREMASIKAFFQYEMRNGRLEKNPSQILKAPKVERKAPLILSVGEVNALLVQPCRNTIKGIRDRAMLELLYATGIRVSELVGLRLEDVNLAGSSIVCRDRGRERVIPFGKSARQALEQYIGGAREEMLRGGNSEWLFTNCSGQAMSRQGFWKLIKSYGEKAGIQADITPHTLRHTLAAHLLRSGKDARSVQAVLGHANATVIQTYANYK